MMKFLALTFYFLARIILTLISSSAITDCFQKVNFQGFNFVILSFELPSAFLYASCELFEKQAVLCGNNSVLLKIRDSLLCVTNRCIEVTTKLILPSISRFKFCTPFKSESAKLRALRVYVLAYLACLRASVLVCFRACVLPCLACLRSSVLGVFTCVLACYDEIIYFLTCIRT